MKAILIIPLFLTFFGTAQAEQSPNELVLQAFDSSRANDLRGLSQSPFKSSVQTIAEIRLWDFMGGGRVPFKVEKFKDPKFVGGKLKYHIYQGDPSNPWVLYVPGIFSYLDSSFVVHMANRLYNQGFNLIILPNRLTWTFQHAEPVFKFGDLQAEADLHCAVVQEVRRDKGFKSKLHLWGVSYGGLLSAVTAARCPKEFTRLTIASPPVDLVGSLNKVLKIIKSSWQSNPQLHNSSYWWLYLKARLGLSESQQVLARFFMDGLFYNIYLDRKNKNLFAQDFAYESKLYAKWQLKTSLEDYYVDSLKLQDFSRESFSLSYWLKQLDTIDFPFYVLAAADDPINQSEDWSPLLQEFSVDRIGLLPHGGHLGFANSQWFKEFIQIRTGAAR